MEEFQIINPSPLLAPYIKHYWMLTVACDAPEAMRTVPTGHICLIFHRGNRIASDGLLQPRAFLSGHESTYSELEYSGVTDMICVVFKPVGARAFFNMPLSEIDNRLVDIYDMGDVGLTDLEKSLGEARTNRESVSLIERFLFRRINDLAVHNLKRIDAAVSIINAGQTNVNSLADAACLSYKQFNRIFSEYVGAKPKEFLRIVRFQRALFLLQTIPEITLAQLACDCGYYDQPHLIKEFKAFSGYTPTEYLSLCAPYSDYFS